MNKYVCTYMCVSCCSNMSKTASASEKPNLFEFFRAPKVFEQSSKIAQAENRVLARAVRTRSQIAERERFIQYRAKARFQALLRRRRFSRQRKEHRDFLFRTANLHTIFEGSMALKRAFSDILQPSLKFSFILRFSLVRA